MSHKLENTDEDVLFFVSLMDNQLLCRDLANELVYTSILFCLSEIQPSVDREAARNSNRDVGIVFRLFVDLIQ